LVFDPGQLIGRIREEQMIKKRKGIFRQALKGRLSAVKVLRDLGMSWAEIAAHFKDDDSLGGASGRHFSSEWCRLHGMGFVPSETECRDFRERLLVSGAGSDWMVFRGHP